jgi:hypothetical protein
MPIGPPASGCSSAALPGLRQCEPGQLIVDLPEQALIRPGHECDFRDQLRPYPMHAAKDERLAKAAGAQGWHCQRHLRRGKRLKATPQSF